MSEVKYIILGHMRSGSTVINESLELHPDLKVAYEVFNSSGTVELTSIPDISQILQKLYGFNKWNMVDAVFSCRWGRKPDEEIFPKSGKYNIGTYKSIAEDVHLDKLVDVVFERYNGFKILYNQLRRNYKVWDYLASYPNLKVIHTYRENYLDSLVSLYVAHGSSDWQLRTWGSAPRDKPFNIDPRVAHEYFYTLDFEIEHFTSMFGENSLKVEYNDLFSWEETMNKVCDFLDVKRVQIEQKYKKRNKKSPVTLIKNYYELAEHFKGTKWDKCFEFFDRKIIL